MTKDDYRFEPLRNHDRAAFSCGKEPLDRYIREQASQDQRRNLAAVFVLVSKNDTSKVVGYYTLSNREVRLDQLPTELAKKAGRYDRLPVILLGRMAVDQTHKGQRLGEFVLLDALHRSLLATQQVASFAVCVDAKDEEAAAFYRRYGFVEFAEDKRRLFLTMRTIQRLPGF